MKLEGRINIEIEDSEEISALKATKEMLNQIYAAMNKEDAWLIYNGGEDYYTKAEVSLAIRMLEMLSEEDACYIE